MANEFNRPEIASEAGTSLENPRTFGMSVMKEILTSYAGEKFKEWHCDREEAARGVTMADVQRLQLAFNSPEMAAYDK